MAPGQCVSVDHAGGASEAVLHLLVHGVGDRQAGLSLLGLDTPRGIRPRNKQTFSAVSLNKMAGKNFQDSMEKLGTKRGQNPCDSSRCGQKSEFTETEQPPNIPHLQFYTEGRELCTAGHRLSKK